MQVGIVVNALAREFRVRPGCIESIAQVAAGRAEVAVTRSLAELDSVARSLVVRGFERVVLCGGDGSHMAGVTAVLAAVEPGARAPAFALAPGGTAGTVARGWGQRGAPAAYVARLLEVGAGASVRRRPTLRVVEVASGERARRERVGFIFGTGLVARFFDAYEARGARGYADAARIVGRTFASSLVGSAYAQRLLAPMPARLTVDERPLPADAYSLVLASVVPDVGLHMRIAPRAGEDAARPHVVASSLPASALGRRAPRVLAGRPIGGPGGFDGLAALLRLEFTGAAATYVLDGDRFEARVVEVSGGPEIDLVEA